MLLLLRTQTTMRLIIARAAQTTSSSSSECSKACMLMITVAIPSTRTVQLINILLHISPLGLNLKLRSLGTLRPSFNPATWPHPNRTRTPELHMLPASGNQKTQSSAHRQPKANTRKSWTRLHSGPSPYRNPERTP